MKMYLHRVERQVDSLADKQTRLSSQLTEVCMFFVGHHILFSLQNLHRPSVMSKSAFCQKMWLQTTRFVHTERKVNEKVVRRSIFNVSFVGSVPIFAKTKATSLSLSVNEPFTSIKN